MVLHARPSELLGANNYMTSLECLLLDYTIIADALKHMEPSKSVSERIKKRRRGWHPPRMYA